MRVDQFIQENGLDALVERTKAKATRHPQFNNLVMVKYDQINSPMGDPLTQQCRGVILDEADNWRIVSWPYNKFFNYGEGHASPIDWETAKVYEKLDGSLCSLWCYQGKWRVSSSGHPSAAGSVHDNPNRTFEDLFWYTWETQGYSLPPDSFQEVCFMFELMTPENRVVIPHKEYRLVLHGARILSDRLDGYGNFGMEINPNSLAHFGWEVVKTHPLTDLASVLQIIESLNGMESEGFVVCDDQFRRIKMKGKHYVALHHLRSQLTPKRLLEVIMSNEGEEFLSYFPEYEDSYRSLKEEFQDFVFHMNSVYEQHKHLESQKDFALAVKDYLFSAALFAARAGKVDSPEQWVRQHDSRRVLAMLSPFHKLEDLDIGESVDMDGLPVLDIRQETNKIAERTGRTFKVKSSGKRSATILRKS